MFLINGSKSTLFAIPKPGLHGDTSFFKCWKILSDYHIRNCTKKNSKYYVEEIDLDKEDKQTDWHNYISFVHTTEYIG